MSMPKRVLGKSRTCPLLAATSKSAPRYLLMVLALAGDSTITKFFFFRVAIMVPLLARRAGSWFPCWRVGLVSSPPPGCGCVNPRTRYNHYFGGSPHSTHTTWLFPVSSPGPAGGGPWVFITRGIAMAFNPFHAFRKHQKALFAGLTILCMVVFVLGGALGNFREITAFFGGGNQPRGNELATLYGKPVTTPDLNSLRVQRE